VSLKPQKRERQLIYLFPLLFVVVVIPEIWDPRWVKNPDPGWTSRSATPAKFSLSNFHTDFFAFHDLATNIFKKIKRLRN
jgi:hypothetical protein